MENFRNPEDRDPKTLGEIMPGLSEEIARRSQASDLEKAKRELLNLLRDEHALPEDVTAANQRVVELEEQERHGD